MVYCLIKKMQAHSKYYYVFLALVFSFFIQFLFPSTSFSADRYAFIINIGMYKRSDLAPIEGANRDERLLRRFLENQGYRIYGVRGSKATRSNIHRRFRQFIVKPKPQDTVIIYFIGYGYRNSLLPYNANKLGSNSIPIKELVNLSSIFRKGKTIYFIAACLNGQFDRKTYQEFDENDAIIILSNCVAKDIQPSFTAKLLQGIEKHGKYKSIYLSDLLNIVRRYNVANVHNVVKHETFATILVFGGNRPQKYISVKSSRKISLPKFPWPPPKASAKVIVPRKYLTPSNRRVYYKDIDSILVIAMDKSGYSEKSYFAVPNGFAIVTKLEQINEDGTSKQNQERWSVDVEPFREFSLKGYFEALFTAKRGFFRIIVFIITDEPFYQTESKVSKSQALDWLRAGYNKLPKNISKLIYTKDHDTTALIYEFVQPGHKKKGTLKYPGRFTGRQHLEKSNILSALGR